MRQEVFPVDCFYMQWKNSEEQLSLFTEILKSPDIFCFTEYPCVLVATDCLKSLPDLENKEIATWRSMQLLETLLYLGEAGHYAVVKELFKFPIQHCPDILVLGLVQATFPYTMLRQDLIASLIPIFLGNHPNAAIILHNAWHTQNNTTTVRQIVMHAMAEWYMMVENDQTRLGRILDVAQDLKALSLLLNAQPFSVVVDLACLAYRREFLKLDKWLTDKIREHGEAFISACVKFLQKRCPQLMGGKDDIMPKSSQLPPETMATILVCLNACVLNVTDELADTIMTMFQHCSLLSQSQRPRTQQQIGFPGGASAQAGEGTLGGIASNLGNLSIGATGGASSTMFPAPSSTAVPLSGSLGTAPGSPGRPLGPLSAPGTSQSPLSSIASAIGLPALQMPPTLPPPVGSQLPALPTSSIIPSTLRSQSVQPTNAPMRQMDITQIFDMPALVTKEVEDEANSYFQRIYNHPPHPTLSIEEVLEMLKKFHDSSNKREREVYSCMLRNLFEEYKFFPTYPDKELFTTARLFGGIIEQGLVEYMALGVALRFVMEALHKPHGSKMYYFGIVALDKYRSRLKEYPRYCQHLMAIPHFNEFPPHLIEYIKYGTQSQEPPSRPSGVVLPPSMNVSPSTPAPSSTTASASAAVSTVGVPPSSAVTSVVTSVVKTMTATTTTTTTSAVTRPQSITGASAAVGSGKPTMTTTNIETLLVATEKEEKITPPPEHIQDKIAFIFNNLSQVNLPQKVNFQPRYFIVGNCSYWLF
ncbi:CCR4-NOT transcription complex subunit 1-like [Macrobrachium nipponense]|uniref:CCR4-NOT transcription complex subunit 1-like n=1 Tax=Macrobrachium nipponense TaxID=159736 RepID=UPI0030C7FDBE